MRAKESMKRRKYFDQIAQEWEIKHSNNREKKKIEKLFPYFLLNRGDTVLDAGCGTGRLVPYIREKIGPQGFLMEIDYSYGMIKIAREKYDDNNIFFIQSDVQQISVKKNVFDCVICYALFPHLSHKEAALRELRSVLKPGGRFFIAHPMSREELNKLHSNLEEPVQHDLLPDKKEMIRLLISAGFSQISIRNEPSLYLAQAKS